MRLKGLDRKVDVLLMMTVAERVVVTQMEANAGHPHRPGGPAELGEGEQRHVRKRLPMRQILGVKGLGEPAGIVERRRAHLEIVGYV
jgi:hypothetical protein